ncbi:hypothetical protein XELAEV_18037184mg [Xenopus laevis]|uniref:Uncharacterized protein n=1 Tax=Xenopus laevis TaxID=8355 RepID=A0A974H9X8_XENLA|nr:hypothetical protein XELAEV_18037184mg [Xenopus laevis]
MPVSIVVICGDIILRLYIILSQVFRENCITGEFVGGQCFCLSIKHVAGLVIKKVHFLSPPTLEDFQYGWYSLKQI